jgi:hypothetical protein
MSGSMYYLIAVQFFCACFCAFIAGRAGSSRLFWWLVGGLLPVVGVALCVFETRRSATGEAPQSGRKAPRTRPKRCCGRYIPECWGCPYFRRRLFSGAEEAAKGHCTFFDRDLADESAEGKGSVIVEDE